MDDFIKELKELKHDLNKRSKPEVMQKMHEQKQELIDLYNKEFSDLPDDDPVKLSILEILLTYKISPYEKIVLK